MIIKELDIHNIDGCIHANLKFNHTSPVIFIKSPSKCEVITLAIQLICSHKYNSYSKICEIIDRVKDGKVTMTFTLDPANKEPGINIATDDHSSDSDVPCTSHQAQERAQRREKRKRMQRMRPSSFLFTACRNFKVDPQGIQYTINNGPPVQCSIDIFHIRFFTCADIILPQLCELADGNYCNGRWLDLLSTDFIYKGVGENHLISQFCELYLLRKMNLEHQLSQLTKTALIGINCVNQSRISNLIYIFQDIRCVFENITCGNYTVWFLLPTTNGNLQDITEITTNNINFDRMKTKVQLTSGTDGSHTSPSSPKILWTETQGYVQELFVAAVQIVFGYHCGQNIIFMNNFEKLNEQQSFEYIKIAYARRLGSQGQSIEKNYLERIADVCSQCNLTCVLDYPGGIAFEPKNAVFIKCEKEYRSKFWTISVKSPVDDRDDASILRKAAKRRFEERHIRFHPDTKYQ